MDRLKQLRESFMWIAKMEDGTQIEEFVRDDNEKIIETNLNEVMGNDNLKTFGITNTEQTLWFDCDTGFFNILGNEICINVCDVDGNSVINSGESNIKRNRLIIFRTNEQAAGGGYDRIIEYSYGYKMENELFHLRAFISVNMSGAIYMNIDVTPKNDFIGSIKILNSQKVLASTQNDLQFKKQKTSKIKIQIGA